MNVCSRKIISIDFNTTDKNVEYLSFWLENVETNERISAQLFDDKISLNDFKAKSNY